jgi:glycosyltransferase involved in cell wall biosynthesis
MNIAMVVLNTFTQDARVSKEAASLVEAGHRVTVYALWAAGLHAEESSAEGYRVRRIRLRSREIHRIPFAAWAELLPRFAIALRRQPPDVVHAHDLNALIPGWLAARLFHAGLVYDSHELFTEQHPPGRPPHPWRKAAWQRLEAALIRRTQAVFTVSPSIAGELAVRYAISSPQVVHNCPRLARLHPQGALRAWLHLPAETPVLMFQGALVEGRGLETCLQALPALPNAALVYLGEGALRPRLQRLAEEIGVSHRFYLPGNAPMAQLQNLARDAAIGLCLTENTCLNHYYSLPNKLFEYLMAGVPVIASDFPEMRRVVVDSRAGAVADPADLPAVIAALQSLLADPQRLATMSQAARQAAETRYHWQHEVAPILDYYAVQGNKLQFSDLTHSRQAAKEVNAALQPGDLAYKTAQLIPAAEMPAQEIHVHLLILNEYPPDMRIHKEALTLAAAGFQVRVVALWRADLPEAENHDAYSVYRLRLRSRRWQGRLLSPPFKYLEFARCYAAFCRLHPPQIIHAHDAKALPPAWLGARAQRAALIYDARELETGRNFGSSRVAPLYRWLWPLPERLFIRRANAVITVSEGIAGELSRLYRVPRPHVLVNCPPAQPARASNRLRAELSIPAEMKIALTQGALVAGRGIEPFLQAVQMLPDVAGVVLGEGPLLPELRRQVESGALRRVYLPGRVPSDALLSYTASADLGAVLIQNTCRSHYFSLPNKLFECIQARLPVVASDLPDIAALVREYDLGELTNPEDPQAIAAAMRRLLDDPQRLEQARRNCNRAAALFHWEREGEKLLAIYRGLVKG